MSRAPDAAVPGRHSVTVPRLWVALALSALVHAIALWQWVPELTRASDSSDRRHSGGPLIVQLSAPPRPPRTRPPARAPEPPRPPAPRPQAAKPPAAKPAPAAAPRPRPNPPILVLDRAMPEAPATAPRAPPAPAAPVSSPSAADLLAYVESQRRARALAAPAPPSRSAARPALPAEDEDARANRLAAANLGLDRAPVFGERRRGGGIFEIERMGYDSAEFLFYGWNRAIRRNTSQIIEVRKGSNSDIKIAVIRRMIEIIREHEQGDFVWESPRLGRNVTLSARARDNAGLEDFLMQEFFEDRRPAAQR